MIPVVFPVRRRVAWLVVVVAVGLFALMAVQIRHGNPGWDTGVYGWFHTWGVAGDYSDWFGSAMRYVTRLGERQASLVVAVPLLVLMGVLRRWRAVVFVAVVPLVGAMTANGLKTVFNHPRPDVMYHYVPARTYSFPSGHTATATVVWLTVALLVSRYLTGRVAKGAALACLVVPLAVGFSRVYLGVHWPSDVVGGMAFGIAWVLTWYLLVFETVPERSRTRPE
ncbi:MAG: phosphatase PAP2 family protein [Micrococcales bacterium]|nr:phosphatase PAP2 family protein [Micrococcales bacterium]